MNNANRQRSIKAWNKVNRQSRKGRPLELEQLELRETPSVLIPVTNHRDLVFDPTRELLYITTSAGTVERYDVVNQKLLTNFSIGTSENGADITANDSFLYVAEDQASSTQGRFHKVDLSNGAVQNINYNLAFGEAGAWDIAIGSGNLGLVTTRFAGSGWVPLRQVDLATDTLSIRTDDPGSGGGGEVRQDTSISRGADRSLLFLTESNISSGPMFTYSSSSNTFPKQADTNFFLGAGSAVNRNGTLIALLMNNGGISIMNAQFQSVANLSNVNGGVVFDPVQDILYAASSVTSQIIAYDTNSWAEKFRLDVGESVTGAGAFGNGVMTVSDDDKLLFLATTQGVRMFNLPASTGVASSLTISGFPSFIAANVAGSFTVTAKDPAGNIATGYTGTVHFTSSDAAASLPANYTFTAADQGVHTFTAILQTAGTQSITVTDAANALSATQGNITVHTNPVSLIPVANHRDLIFDPTRNRLYITTDAGTIERYDLATQTLLAPFNVGNSLYGGDITKNGNLLYVADGQRGATQGFFRKVDLTNGAVTNLAYNLGSLEGGAWDLRIASNGLALLDTRFEGSGWVPLRELDLSTDTLSVRTDDPGSDGRGNIRQDTLIMRGADRNLLFFTESNISSGPFFYYLASSNSFSASKSSNQFLGNSAVSRNSALFALEVGGTITVMDQSFNTVKTLSNVDGGVTFDPLRDILYAATSTTNQIIAYDTSTWSELYRLNTGETIGGASPFGDGVMTVSNDGRWLFLSTSSGVRIFSLVLKPDDLVGRWSQAGQWWVAASNGSTGFSNSSFATWSPAVTWVDVVSGDFNGDGLVDIAGRDPQTGIWWVGLSTGSSFTTTPWTTWSTAANWVDVKVGDFTGDGKDDILGRYQQAGQWWLATSTGSSFTNSLWTTWSTAATWVDVKAGDFNGDGKMDITGRWLQGGSWWTGISNGSAFSTSQWGAWSPAVNWVDVNVGDFNGDGKADLVGRWPDTGQWWVAQSTGSSFTNALWTTWAADSPSLTWVDVKVGDFNGDGKTDIIGRWLQTGQWWVALSMGSSFSNSLWATWSPAATWVDVQVGDFNADGKADITGRWLEGGSWWTGISTGSSLTTSQWTTWATGVSWVDVRVGEFV